MTGPVGRTAANLGVEEQIDIRLQHSGTRDNSGKFNGPRLGRCLFSNIRGSSVACVVLKTLERAQNNGTILITQPF
jgi:hypothetical protein